jgi:hypothetical protein
VSAALRPSLWRRIGNSWRSRSKSQSTVDVTPEGVAATEGRRTIEVRWNDIVRIDCGTRDTITMDVFFVVLHTASVRVTIDELADGFRVFENAMFEHWPQLREHWVALQCGPLHQPQYETLWQR